MKLKLTPDEMNYLSYEKLHENRKDALRLARHSRMKTAGRLWRAIAREYSEAIATRRRAEGKKPKREARRSSTV